MTTESSGGYSDDHSGAHALQNDAPLTVCLLGLTGVGKSATGNTLLGDRENSAFVASSSSESVTAKTSSVIGRWRGIGQEVRVVDTPGWLDSGGRDVDTENRKDMAEALKELKEVHAFLLLMNAADPRINGSAISLVKLLASLFGKGFLRNLVVAYTHWDYDAASTGDRQDDNDGMEEKAIRSQKQSGLNAVFREIIGHSYGDFPCIFIDNRVNFYTDAQLKRRFKGEEIEALNELDTQLDVLLKVMSTRRAFNCKGVSVLRASRAEEVHNMVPHYVQLGLTDDAKGLNRQLKLGDQDVLFSGWMWYRRTWIFGKLRRQSLRFYESDASNALPFGRLSAIDLKGAVCAPTNRLAFSAQSFYFTIHKPPVATNFTDAGSYRFGVSAQDEHRRWISMVMEATQISDGCSRVQKLHDSLTGAKSKDEYSNAVNNVEQQTIIVPVEWMQQRSSSEVLVQAAAQTAQHQDQSPQQLKKDFLREDISFLGEEVIRGPEVDALMEKIAMGILEETESTDESRMRACAMALARDTLFCCSRTLGGGIALGAVETLFKNEDLVNLVDDQERKCPNCLTKVRPDAVLCSRSECGAKVEHATIDVRILRSKEKSDALRIVDNASGVCELQGEDGEYGKEDVQRIRSVEFVKGIEIDRKSWIPDEEWENCMICGLSFSIFLRRRHHCRMCGKVVCQMCSQQRIMFGTTEQRTCFVCYTKSYLMALRDIPENEDKEEVDDSDSGSQISADGATTPGVGEDQSAPPAAEVAETELPCISVTMVQNFKICAEPDLDVLYYLHCRFFRIVRWDGCADTGRVFISIRRPPSH